MPVTTTVAQSLSGGGTLLGGGMSPGLSASALTLGMGAAGDPCLNAVDVNACHDKLASMAMSKQGASSADLNALMQQRGASGTDLNAPMQQRGASGTDLNAPMQQRGAHGLDTSKAQPGTASPTRQALPPEYSEFQDFVSTSLNQKLPIYGYDLFNQAPGTFAPVENIPVTSDYLIGPGDELIIKGWGQVDIDVDAVVDRNGQIDIPKVGTVNVAGVRYQKLQGYLKNAIGHVFRNFELNVTLGKLRSIQVYVVGQARQPGVYTVSSLSTLVNTLFASGGPSVTGSMRHIQVKRNGKLVTEFDMYDLLLKGDKTRDVHLLPGDVIYIPPVGQLVAISGSVNNPAIYELKDDKTTLSGLLGLAGGLTTVAKGDKVRVERIDDRKMRQVEEFPLDSTGLDRVLKDGDLVEVMPIDGQFENAVTLRGNVANPGRYPWKKDMRVKDLIPNVDSLIVPGYWQKQNQIFSSSISEQGLNQEIISRNSAGINWDYAVIQRLRKSDLSTVLIPFNLGNAINGKNLPDDLPLEPGDVVTIFSKSDIRVPVAKKSVYVRLEGEVKTPGIYKALPGETLRQLVARIGGLTPNAYLFGAELDRQSVQQMQQQRLQEMADRMQADIERNLAAKQQNAISVEDTNAAKGQAEAQLELVKKMRSTRATGRVVLEIPPRGAGVKELPDIALEDGDRFYVPSKPSTVSVMGMVYNENAFMYRTDGRVSDYLAKAGGPTRDADTARIYLLRADGSVISAQNSSSIFGSFSGDEMMPGDTLVVPEQLDKFAFTKELKDWAQIFYQFALGVAGIKVLKM